VAFYFPQRTYAAAEIFTRFDAAVVAHYWTLLLDTFLVALVLILRTEFSCFVFARTARLAFSWRENSNTSWRWIA